MLRSPEYVHYNSMQKRDSTAIMKDYANVMHWSDNENVLDVGCGPGDSTVDIILPLLSENSQLTGLDISQQAIEYARNTCTDKRVSFVTADFSSERITDVLPQESFTKIISFYCLHWIPDQKRVAENLSSLLRPGGDVLAVIMANSNAYRLFLDLSEMEKFKPFMQDVGNYISPYFNVPNIKQTVYETFPSVGLAVNTFELRHCSFTFPSFDCQLQSLAVVNPFLARIPDELKAEFNDSVKQLVMNYETIQDTDAPSTTSYNLVVLHLQKP